MHIHCPYYLCIWKETDEQVSITISSIAYLTNEYLLHTISGNDLQSHSFNIYSNGQDNNVDVVIKK